MGRRDDVMVDITDLGVIPRILFATDGAITHILEGYAGEPVDSAPLTTSPLVDPSARRELELADGERAVRRTSLLRGRATARVFVHGDDVVALDRLPEPVVDELSASGAGLLEVLSRHRIGTFRETVGEWEGHDGEIAAHFGSPADEVLVGRTYEVVVGGRAVAWITERFPKHGFCPSPLRGLEGAGP